MCIRDSARANQSGNTTKTFAVDFTALNSKYLRIDSGAGNQTVLSSGTTTFVGTISPANYDLDSLPLLP